MRPEKNGDSPSSPLPEGVIEKPELRGRTHVFRDRVHAGEVLADMLAGFRQESYAAMAIPAGGVPVGKRISERLGIPIDLAVVSKITLPWNPEAGYGAVAFDGTVRLNKRMIGSIGLTEPEVQAGIEKTIRKVRRRMNTFYGGRPFPERTGRSIVLIDDGLASGFTMLAAIEAVKKLAAGRLIVAVPTAHLESIEPIAASVDAVFCPNIRSGPRYAVAEAYEYWTDVDEEALFRLMKKDALFKEEGS